MQERHPKLHLTKLIILDLAYDVKDVINVCIVVVVGAFQTAFAVFNEMDKQLGTAFGKMHCMQFGRTAHDSLACLCF